MCGIFGLIHNNKNTKVCDLVDIINSLKHRGKDTYGVCYNYDNEIINYKTDNINKLYNIDKSFILCKSYITHNRYSTSKNKKNILKESQPLIFKNDKIEFSLVHNGNISNVKKYIEYEEYEDDLSDTQNIIKFFNNISEENFENKLKDFIDSVHCSYSIIILYKEILYVLRDRYGYKPLILGLYENNYCISSEDCINNFLKIRDIKNGEILKISKNKYESIYKKESKIELKCIFEYIYFMDEKSTFNNHDVLKIREKLGINLGKLENIKFNKEESIVVGSPNTAIPMGESYARYLDLVYKQLLVKKVDCGRTFILKDQKSRKNACKKFIVDEDLIKNKVIILVDDSIVRGNTLESLSKLFYNNGCKELHIRICSSEIKNPCYYGIDIPTSKELIINNYKISEIEKLYNLNSLKYITIKKMKEVFGEDKGFCMSCFNGDYNKELDW